MTAEIQDLRNTAFYYRDLLKVGEITYNEAKQYILPYIKVYNKQAKEKALKFGLKPHLLNFAVFVR